MTQEFDSHASTYQAAIEKATGLFGQKHSFFVRDKLEKLINAFKQVDNPANMKVLDIGCGIGLGHDELASVVGELHGVDTSEQSLALANRDHPNVKYQSYDGHRLPYANGSFDCAYAICVLHHVPKLQWTAFVAEMFRVVRPGGLLIVIEHNPLNPATQWVVRTCDLDKNATLLFASRIRKMFNAVGIPAPRVGYTLFTPFASASFRALDRKLSRIPLGAQYFVTGRKPS